MLQYENTKYNNRKKLVSIIKKTNAKKWKYKKRKFEEVF